MADFADGMVPVLTLTMNPAIDIATAVERVEPVHKLRCTAPRRDPGGGGINVARVVARMGGAVTAIYPVGGAGGQQLQRLVESEGVRSSTFAVKDETRLSFTVTETASGDEFRFVLPGESFREADWRAALDTLGQCAQRGYLVLSGSLPPGVPADFYAHAASVAKARGCKVVVDTSGPAATAALREGVYLIKPNLQELEAIAGRALPGESDWLGACLQIVETGQAEIVALTLGANGAMLVSKDIRLRAAPLPIVASSSVGAGDSFLGALVWALADGRTQDDAFRWANAAGSAALLTPGTELCRREDVERLAPLVALESI
jgi:6-phosphofructokinase 2